MLYYERMDKLQLFVFGPLVIAATLLAIVKLIRPAIARFRSRPTADQIKAAYDAYLSRLLNPQADAVERELGKFLPERLLQLCFEHTISWLTIYRTRLALPDEFTAGARDRLRRVFLFQRTPTNWTISVPHTRACLSCTNGSEALAEIATPHGPTQIQ